jgi:hypothetical protein
MILNDDNMTIGELKDEITKLNLMDYYINGIGLRRSDCAAILTVIEHFSTESEYAAWIVENDVSL